jgi:polysaccharide pyruvyl transferase WcaK-like protein
MIKILLPEDFPAANKGEAALFFGMMESLKELGPHQIEMFSLHAERDRAQYADVAEVIDSTGIIPQHMLDSVGSRWYKLWNYIKFLFKHVLFLFLYLFLRKNATKLMPHRVWKSYVDADIVLMSHDSFWTPFFHGPLILFFRLLGKPVVLYAASIIPPHPYQHKLVIRFRNWFNRFVLRRAHLITLREKLSYDYVSSLGVASDNTQVAAHADLAFVLPPADKEDIDRIVELEQLPTDEILIGVAFTQRKLEFAFPELESRAERQQKALPAHVELINFLTEELGATVVFIPHSIGPTPKVDDRITADWIRDKAVNKDKLIIMRNDYTPNQLKGLASRLDMTVGQRLHFTIDATSQGIPSMLITHREDFRCHGIIGETLNQQKHLYNIEAVDGQEMIAIARDLWENRAAVRKSLLEQMEAVKADVYKHGQLTKELLDRFYAS